MATPDEGWNPPNARELLEANIVDGSSWYELRLPLKTLSYSIDQWDEAIGDAKAFKRVFKRSALLFCHKTNGALTAEEIW